MTADKVIWAQALGRGTSTQKAELIALTQALWWGKGKAVTVYTDSRYAFAIVHVHGALYQERGLLRSGGKEIKKCPRNPYPPFGPLDAEGGGSHTLQRTSVN